MWRITTLEYINQISSYKTWFEIFEKIIIPSISSIAIPILLGVVGYFLKNLNKELEKERKLQNEHFAHSKRLELYDKLAEKITQTNNTISQSVIIYQGMIAILLGELYKSDKEQKKEKDTSWIEKGFTKLEETHRELGIKVIDLFNTYKTYNIIFNENAQVFSDQIMSKMKEIRTIYDTNYPKLLLYKLCAIHKIDISVEDKKDVLDLFENASPAYKKQSDELIEIINKFCNEAQTILLGNVFQ